MLEKFKTKSKFGFSLFEVVVTMSIVAIFVAACSNIFTQRHKTRISLPAHGRFACYYDDSGNLKQEMYSENVELESRTVTGKCSFTPPRTASYLIIAAVGGGGYGGTTYGGSAGSYTSVFLSSTTHQLNLYPGRAAASSGVARGETTRIDDIGDTGTDTPKTIVELEGGRSDSSSNLLFKDCTISYSEFACRLEAACHSDENSKVVSVSYCSENDPTFTKTEVEKTVEIPFDDSVSRTDDDGVAIPSIRSVYSDMTPAQLAEGSVSYTFSRMIEVPGYADPQEQIYFTFAVVVEGNYTPDEDISPINGYINALGIETGIGALSVSPGNGGAKNKKGGTGAVLIVW